MNPHENDEQILARLIDNDCSPGQVAEIERRLQTEPEFRTLYRRMCDFEASAAIVIGGKGTMVEFPNQSAKRPKPIAMLAIAAAAAILLVAGQLIFGSRGDSPEPVELSFGGSAKVAGAGDLPTSLAPGKTLSLEKGRVDLSFQRGKARATVQAPAKFFFRKDGSLEVADGSFGLELKPGSERLRCIVGDHLIEDIGTTYSFLAEKGTLKEISVSEGRIRLSAGTSMEPQIILAGFGLHSSPGGFVPFRMADFPPSSTTLFEWNPRTDTQSPVFVSEPQGTVSLKDDALVFSSKTEAAAWLDLPSGFPLAPGNGYSIEFEATLPTGTGGLVQKHGGISLFDGDTERIFLGKQLHNRDGWVAVIYPESGNPDERRIVDLGVSKPRMTFRIGYDAGGALLSIGTWDGKAWIPLISEKSRFVPSFSRIRLTAIDSSFSLHWLKINGQ